MSYNNISDFLKKYGFKNIAEAKLNSNDLKFIKHHHQTLEKIIDTILNQQNIDVKTLPQPNKELLPISGRKIVSDKDVLTFNEWLKEN